MRSRAMWVRSMFALKGVQRALLAARGWESCQALKDVKAIPRDHPVG